ncbi:ATP-binding cassette domain-containing protein [Roseinatronobacter alkalisoli]|uniref:ATP-binding cassette domain-containing protein n=1 Tax=Roseinatronobacter alkalisoli TaxID=3028235 RepID=A0ABT5T3J5_9RHOB|nr:ATP-binding cassette domain-containing protein [Roseinatronobacter sp. HJB301]MDD7969685.1 ATP-binding cassette domain-containing protein [Roseinatronobacter sp. HJB301]
MTLRLENLCITLAGRVLAKLDLTVSGGNVLTIMGPSGCGKSTVLAALIGALPPAFSMRGRIWLDGVDVTQVPTHARRMGILFQNDILFPHMSVAGNLGFGLPGNVTARRAATDAALSEAGLPGMGARDPATLSGGQRARVALMRTLLSGPRALLLDEPFSSLDSNMRASMRQFVFERATERNLPVILVTHDHDDARAAAGPVINVMGERIQL